MLSVRVTRSCSVTLQQHLPGSPIGPNPQAALRLTGVKHEVQAIVNSYRKYNINQFIASFQ